MKYTCPAEKEIIKEIAHDLGTSIEQVLQVVKFQREYVQKVMMAGDFSGVMLPYLGKFFVKPERLIKLNNKKDELICN